MSREGRETTTDHPMRRGYSRDDTPDSFPPFTEKVHDAITGHTPATEGRKYGQPSVADMAKALKKFPRFKLK
jgi:hypothetical protein